jgi:hypothetical protein
MSNPADPPTPIPSFLYPQPGPIGDGDLVMTATAEEWQRIAELVERVANARQVRTLHRDGSPWLEIAVAIGPAQAQTLADADLNLYGVERFALWRYTLAVYRVGDDGAVEDDPILPPINPLPEDR